MAVTVLGKNFIQLSGCESTADGGTWTGVDTQDGTNFKEGTYSLTGTLKASGDNDATFTPTSSVDMSGTKHLRCWYINTSGGLINTFANGGIQMGVSDGSNTGFWYLAGRDTYSGGWINLVVDVSSDVDAGTKPTNMNAITSIIIRHNQTTGKNVDNVWIDNLCLCDGLIAYGDDGGSSFDFDDIYNIEETPSTGGWGIMRKLGGQYFLTGSLEVGDSVGTNSCDFNGKSSVVVFEDRPVSSGIYNVTVVDNGTGTTDFTLGSKAGTAGIEGCVVRVADVNQAAKYDVVASGTNVDNFKLYGSTFLDAGSVEFPATASGVEVLNTTFESCGEVIPDTCVVQNCNFISSNDRGIRIDTVDHNVTDCTFISCIHGVNVTLSGSVDFDNLTFIGSDGVTYYDIEHSVSGTLNIQALNGTNANESYVDETAGGNTNIANAVSLDLKIIDENSANIQDAWCYIEDSGQVQLMSEQSLADGTATESYNYGGDESVIVRVRKYGYKYYKSNATITSGGLNVTVTLITDPQQT